MALSRLRIGTANRFARCNAIRTRLCIAGSAPTLDDKVDARIDATTGIPLGKYCRCEQPSGLERKLLNRLTEWARLRRDCLMLLAAIASLSEACHDAEWTYRRDPSLGTTSAGASNSIASPPGNAGGGTELLVGSDMPFVDTNNWDLPNESVDCFVEVLTSSNVESLGIVPTPLEASRFRLRADMKTLATGYAELLAHFSGRSGVLGDLLQDAQNTCKTFVLPPAKTPNVAFDCVPDTASWVPYGLTTTYDAAANGKYEGHSAMAISWYRVVENQSTTLEPSQDTTAIRVSFVNLDDLENVTYLNALLVESTPSGFRIVEGQRTGGIVWYGDFLYVSNAEYGIRLFDVTRLVRTSDLELVSSENESFDADVVLPQVGTLIGVGDPFNYSLISLDRGSPEVSLIVGEHHEPTSPGTDRLLRFALDASTHLPKVDGDDGSPGIEAYDTLHQGLSGVATRDAEFWLAREPR